MKKIVQMAVLFLIFGAMQSVSASAIFINEIHYDNTGADVGEGVEIAGPSGTDLSGWSLALYNGSNGSVYSTWLLSGIILDEIGGFGALSFSVSGMQNGSPDGLALIDSSSSVRQFLSYEGEMTAFNGVAAGMVSDDIGVFESGSTPVGTSLQLMGEGVVYDDFVWSASGLESFAAINSGQVFRSLTPPPSIPPQTIASSAAVPEPNILLLLALGLIPALKLRTS